MDRLLDVIEETFAAFMRDARRYASIRSRNSSSKSRREVIRLIGHLREFYKLSNIDEQEP